MKPIKFLKFIPISSKNILLSHFRDTNKANLALEKENGKQEGKDCDSKKFTNSQKEKKNLKLLRAMKALATVCVR